MALLLVLLATIAPLNAQKESAQKQTAPHDRVFFNNYGVDGKLQGVDAFGNVVFAKLDGGKIKTDITEVKFLRLNKGAEIPANQIRLGYIFRLNDNTRITGNIVTWGDDAITIHSEYAGTVKIERSAVRYIYTSYSSHVGKLWSLPNQNALILRGQTKMVPFDVITPEFSEPKGFPRQISAFTVRSGDGVARTVPIAKIAGVVFAASDNNAPQPALGWYSFVTTANLDRLPGVLEEVDGGKVQLTTSALGVLKIDRRYVEYIIFSETPQTQRGHLLACDFRMNEIAEYDREMNAVWTQKVNHMPYFASRLENGNILISIPQENSLYEINPRQFQETKVTVPAKTKLAPNTSKRLWNPTVKAKINQFKVVWSSKASIKHPAAAKRLPNGNTLVADELNFRIIELNPDGYQIGEYFLDQCRPTYVTQLPNGNLLVCGINNNRGEVFEGTRDGKIIRSWDVSRPNYAEPLPDGRIVVANASSTRAVYMIEKDSTKAVRTKHEDLYEHRLSITDQGNLVYYIRRNQIPALVFYTPDAKRIKCWALPSTMVDLYMTELD